MVNALRWTEEQLAAHRSRVPIPAPVSATLPVATGTPRQPDMNKTEAEYAAMLQAVQPKAKSSGGNLRP